MRLVRSSPSSVCLPGRSPYLVDAGNSRYGAVHKLRDTLREGSGRALQGLASGSSAANVLEIRYCWLALIASNTFVW